MSFKPLQKLNVTRTLSTGACVLVGVLAQNRQGVFFQYQADYLQRFGNLSPFSMQAYTVYLPIACRMAGGYFYKTAFSDNMESCPPK